MSAGEGVWGKKERRDEVCKSANYNRLWWKCHRYARARFRAVCKSHSSPARRSSRINRVVVLIEPPLPALIRQSSTIAADIALFPRAVVSMPSDDLVDSGARGAGILPKVKAWHWVHSAKFTF